jgi:hypothetical protein
VPHITIEGDSEIQSLASNVAIPIMAARVEKYERELQERLTKIKKEFRDGNGGRRPEVDELEEKIIECQLVLSKLSHISNSYRAVGGGWPDHIVNLLCTDDRSSTVELVPIGKARYGSCEEVFAAWFRTIVSEDGDPARILACGVGHAYTVVPVLSTRLMEAIVAARASGNVEFEWRRLIGEVKNDGKRIMFIHPNYGEFEGIGIGAFGRNANICLFARRGGVDYPFSSNSKGCDCFFKNLATYRPIGWQRRAGDENNANRQLVAA